MPGTLFSASITLSAQPSQCMPVTWNAAVARCVGAGLASFCALFSLESWSGHASAVENDIRPASSDEARVSSIFLDMVILRRLGCQFATVGREVNVEPGAARPGAR